MKGAEYLLDGYVTGNQGMLEYDGERYNVQYYQGKHSNEYVLSGRNGRKLLFKNGVLKQEWTEINERRIGRFTAYERGAVKFEEDWKDILNQTNMHRLVNGKNGVMMEILSIENGVVCYRGGFDSDSKRNGRGIEYNEDTGDVKLEGVWERGRLKQILRIFEGDEMTELKGIENNVNLSKQIPVYVGGYRFDESEWKFKRHGKGCLIDERTRMAFHEGEWEDGKEISGTDLVSGWYDCSRKQMVSNLTEWKEVSCGISDLVIDSDCCNVVRSLDLRSFEWLRTVEIGDCCFGDVNEFRLEGLRNLESVKIGKNSFTAVKSSDVWGNESARKLNRCFHIVKCNKLKSISIGEFSFCDYGGVFELSDLQSLESLQIGTVKVNSSNFCFASFCVKGLGWESYQFQDLPKLNRIILGDRSFIYSLSTEFVSMSEHIGMLCRSSQS